MDKNITLERALFYFVRHKEAHGKATNTTKITYVCILEDFIKSIEANAVNDLDILIIDNFIDTLSLRGYKPKTIKNKVVVIEVLLNFCMLKTL